MRDDHSQALHVRGGHGGHGFTPVHLFAEAPSELQLPTSHHRIDLKEVTSSSRLAAVAAGRFTRRAEQCLFIQHAIDLAQVVKADFCLRERAELLTCFAEVSQHAVSESLSRYLAHLLLDLLHYFADLSAINFQQHRINRREPTDRA